GDPVQERIRPRLRRARRSAPAGRGPGLVRAPLREAPRSGGPEGRSAAPGGTTTRRERRPSASREPRSRDAARPYRALAADVEGRQPDVTFILGFGLWPWRSRVARVMRAEEGRVSGDRLQDSFLETHLTSSFTPDTRKLYPPVLSRSVVPT